MIEPVEILIERDHKHKKKEPRWDEKKQKLVQPPGCAICEKAMGHVNHLGAPPSMNAGGSGFQRNHYQNIKKAWEVALLDKLEEVGLPKGLHSVFVEAQIGFSTRTPRDEGNLRWMIEKAMGDMLQVGGWLEDDSFWPVKHYSFGSLEGVHAPGRSFTRLMLFPTALAVSEE